MSQQLLLIDRGNSGVKWLLLSTDEAPRRGAGVDHLPASTSETSAIPAIIASVADEERNEALCAQLADRGYRPWLAKTPAALGGLSNSYREPERMGVDRWLAMLAARHRYPGRLCVVDAGSALTIDFVDAHGNHEGGFIIPGAALMQRALFSDTDRVRFDLDTDASLAPGQSTAEAVSNGLLLAQAGAIKLALGNARVGGDAPKLFLCGGGAQVLRTAITESAVLVEDLVFEGLLLQATLQNVVEDHWPGHLAA